MDDLWIKLLVIYITFVVCLGIAGICFYNWIFS